MIVCPYTPEAIDLLEKGEEALLHATYNGIPVDVTYCVREQAELHEQMRETEDRAWTTIEGGREWRRRYGSTASLGNDNQVRDILFNLLKLQVSEDYETDGDNFTESGVEGTDKDILSHVDHPLARIVLDYRKARKTADTFLKGLVEEQVSGVIHPWFHLHVNITYRSSSSGPNFQNFPIRDPIQGATVRRAFVSGDGWCFIEIDYKGIEVAVSTCYHMDPRMVQYQIDDYDFHSDSTRECYLLTQEQLDHVLPKKKAVRHAGKNKFTFPEFYGSFWTQVAPGLWQAMVDGKFAMQGGMTFADHLKSHGIAGLGKVIKDPSTGRILGASEGSYYGHIKRVEEKFWKERFPIYAQWKREWYSLYQKRGWFKTKTGFYHEGVFRRNEVVNYPIQGDAFHCNLYSFIRLDEELRRRKMKTYLCGQIHDSIVARVRITEREQFLGMVKEISQKELLQHWDWIKVPIRVEVEATPEGGSWYDKKEIEFN